MDAAVSVLITKPHYPPFTTYKVELSDGRVLEGCWLGSIDRMTITIHPDGLRVMAFDGLRFAISGQTLIHLNGHTFYGAENKTNNAS